MEKRAIYIMPNHKIGTCLWRRYPQRCLKQVRCAYGIEPKNAVEGVHYDLLERFTGTLKDAYRKERDWQVARGYRVDGVYSEEHKRQRTGKNNPMYGRTGAASPRYGVRGAAHPLYGKEAAFKGMTHTDATKATLSKAQDAMKVKVRIDDVLYESLHAAKRATGVSVNTIKNRCASSACPNYERLDE